MILPKEARKILEAVISKKKEKIGENGSYLAGNRNRASAESRVENARFGYD